MEPTGQMSYTRRKPLSEIEDKVFVDPERKLKIIFTQDTSSKTEPR